MAAAETGRLTPMENKKVYFEFLRSVLNVRWRKLESLIKKICNRKWAVVFNRACLKEELIPNYCRNKYVRSNLHNSFSNARSLIEREMNSAINDLAVLNTDFQKEEQLLYRQFVQENEREAFVQLVCDTTNRYDAQKKACIANKLSNLYGSSFLLKDSVNHFVNLSRYTPTDDEEKFLNLGYNCHVPGRYDEMKKQVELEILYRQIESFASAGKLKVNERLHALLKAEGLKHRNPPKKIARNLLNAATSLRNNPGIVIRKADKSNMYVILDSTEYFNKLDDIISDDNKFQKISRDPTHDIKIRANVLIAGVLAADPQSSVKQIIGDFSPGYIYGNVKTHKDGCPLRPIISQCPTPTFELAKFLVGTLSAYCPSTHTVKSSFEFVNLIKGHRDVQGIMASLDVSNLFTNVPTDATIDIILQYVYHNDALRPPAIPRDVMDKLLRLCTKELPFRHPKGQLFIQIDGVAMGSPLGPLFANFYMGHLEKIVFNRVERPILYVRYVDDIFVICQDLNKLDEIKAALHENSVLNFTVELSDVQQRLSFLDVLITQTASGLSHDVYVKPSNGDTCMNGAGYCPEKYKESVVFNFLARTYEISSSWHSFDVEVKRIKNILINNNYTNSMFDRILNMFLCKKINDIQSKQAAERANDIPIRYCAQMHDRYKLDEEIIRGMICDNVTVIEAPENRLNFNIYYNNKKSHNMIMRNSCSRPNFLQQTNVVYKFTCPHPHVNVETYIGHTRTTLSRRLTMHTQGGSIAAHFTNHHKTKLTRKILEANISVIDRDSDVHRLKIREALHIIKSRPTINIQDDHFGRSLHLFGNYCFPRPIHRGQSVLAPLAAATILACSDKVPLLPAGYVGVDDDCGVPPAVVDPATNGVTVGGSSILSISVPCMKGSIVEDTHISSQVKSSVPSVQSLALDVSQTVDGLGHDRRLSTERPTPTQFTVECIGFDDCGHGSSSLEITSVLCAKSSSVEVSPMPCKPLKNSLMTPKPLESFLMSCEPVDGFLTINKSVRNSSMPCGPLDTSQLPYTPTDDCDSFRTTGKSVVNSSMPCNLVDSSQVPCKFVDDCVCLVGRVGGADVGGVLDGSVEGVTDTMAGCVVGGDVHDVVDVECIAHTEVDVRCDMIAEVDLPVDADMGGVAGGVSRCFVDVEVVNACVRCVCDTEVQCGINADFRHVSDTGGGCVVHAEVECVDEVYVDCFTDCVMPSDGLVGNSSCVDVDTERVVDVENDTVPRDIENVFVPVIYDGVPDRERYFAHLTNNDNITVRRPYRRTRQL